MEKIPQNKEDFLIDKENNPGGLKFIESDFDDFFFKQLGYNLEHLKPSFKDFFSRVVKEQPDYVVFLDKGARPFATPFKKYFNNINLSNPPKILFWNDERYKSLSEKNLAQDLLKKDFIDSNPDKDFSKKKIFVVDETYYSGRGARMLRDFFDINHVDGHYFSFTHESRSSTEGLEEDEKDEFKDDERFTIYDNHAGPSFFPKQITKLYLMDSIDPITGKIVTSNRFAFIDSSDGPKDNQSQEKLKKQKELIDETRKKVSDAIYNTLTEI